MYHKNKNSFFYDCKITHFIVKCCLFTKKNVLCAKNTIIIMAMQMKRAFRIAIIYI